MEHPAASGSHISEIPAKPHLCNGEPGDAAKPCLADWDGDKAVAFLKEAANLLCEHVATRNDLTLPVVRLASPAELEDVFRKAGVPLELRPGEEAAAMPRLLAALTATLVSSVRTGHPLFLNQLYARPEPAGIAGDWLTCVANTNVHTYEAAPVFTLVESAVLARMAACVGAAWAHAHDGLFVPGGSIANLYGMHLARAVADPDAATRGMRGGPRLVAFTSAQVHYSYLKNARVCGLGSDNLVSVPCDAGGAILPAELEAAVEQTLAVGGMPFFVGATAGSTVLGAFDPLSELARVCRRHNMWLHVDGAWGGACLLSRKHRALMAGVELADSLAWNPHKMMGLPIQCSVFLTRREGLLQSTNSSNADYLFQPDKLHADMDLGDKTIQCGRRADAYKLWLAWKALGDAGLEQRVDRNLALAEHFESAVLASGGAFQMVLPRSFANVCFWWLPPSLRPFDAAAASPQQKATLGKVAPALKMRMQRSGDVMIGFQPLGALPNFFRVVFTGASALRAEDIDALMARMDALGQELLPA